MICFCLLTIKADFQTIYMLPAFLKQPTRQICFLSSISFQVCALPPWLQGEEYCLPPRNTFQLEQCSAQ